MIGLNNHLKTFQTPFAILPILLNTLPTPDITLTIPLTEFAKITKAIIAPVILPTAFPISFQVSSAPIPTKLLRNSPKSLAS